MTVLHVAPINPISLDLEPIVHSYTAPLFQQNWQLFAPNPVSQEQGILVRAIISDSGSMTRTGYYDLTSPEIDAIHSTRLFPPRRTRLETTIQQLLTYHDPLAERLRIRIGELQTIDPSTAENRFEGILAEQLPLTLGEEQTQRLALQLLRGVATRAAISQWGDGVTHIQVRFVTNVFPPFSQRGSGEKIGRIFIEDSEWMEVSNWND